MINNNPKQVRTFWNEQWVKVKTKRPTVKCDYFFSNFGRIKSVVKQSGDERLLKGTRLATGQLTLNIKLEQKAREGFYIHQLVAREFLPPPQENQKFILHMDGNKNNNHWKNLKWATQRELTDFQIECGVYNPNNRKRSPITKMTESKVKLLKKYIQAGKTKKTILARRFGISTMQLNRIERGENWGHVN